MNPWADVSVSTRKTTASNKAGRVSLSRTIEKWETGAKKPSGVALKLLTIVRKHVSQVLALMA